MTPKKVSDIRDEISNPPILPIERAIFIGTAIILCGALVLLLFGC